MIAYIIAWMAAIIFVEATTEIEVTSVLFSGVRERLIKIRWVGWYVHGLFSCGYCLSVWVSAVAALFVPGDVILWTTEAFLGKLTTCATPFTIADYIFKIFVIHRLANVWHEGVYRWLERMPFVLAFKSGELTDNILGLTGENDEEQGAETRPEADNE